MWFGMISAFLYSLGSVKLNFDQSQIQYCLWSSSSVRSWTDGCMISLLPGFLPYWGIFGAGLTWYWRGCELYAGFHSSSRSSSQPHLLLIKQFQAGSVIPGPTLFPLIINDICVPMAHENESNIVIVWWGREHIKGTLYLVRWSCGSHLKFSTMIRCCLIADLHTAFLEVKYLSHSLRLFPWIRRLAVTCDHGSIVISSPLVHLSLSIPVPLSLSVSSALILSLHSQPYLWAWERNSGNIFPCETPSTSRGVWRHCIVSAGEKRNRARWGQILSTPKKQPLSHTGFLPRWTAQNNPIVVGPKECERGINQRRAKGKRAFFYRFMQTVYEPLKTNKGATPLIPAPPTVANWHPHNKEWTGTISRWTAQPLDSFFFTQAVLLQKQWKILIMKNGLLFLTGLFRWCFPFCLNCRLGTVLHTVTGEVLKLSYEWVWVAQWLKLKKYYEIWHHIRFWTNFRWRQCGCKEKMHFTFIGFDCLSNWPEWVKLVEISRFIT